MYVFGKSYKNTYVRIVNGLRDYQHKSNNFFGLWYSPFPLLFNLILFYYEKK